ncbi:Serine--pyruvate aminotransferase [Papilio machaon]|uniref:Serine--pyruvate aminotransferase n=1 Tax=Papilio machaon TaxID=76193 RepID=A0A0N1II65_PAPMA|nr:Serine--pyruvate aminotransferase [Papilio machaon]
MSPPLVWALRECLRQLSIETLEKSWERHAKTSRYFYERLQRLPIEFLVPNPEHRLTTVVPLVLRKAYNYNDVVKYIKEK